MRNFYRDLVAPRLVSLWAIVDTPYARRRHFGERDGFKFLVGHTYARLADAVHPVGELRPDTRVDDALRRWDS